MGAGWENAELGEAKEMIGKKIVVPAGMEDAARKAYEAWRSFCRPDEQWTNGAVMALRAALRWLSDHPILPTLEQCSEVSLPVPCEDSGNGRILARAFVEFQRRMFIASDCPADCYPARNVIEACHQGRANQEP